MQAPRTASAADPVRWLCSTAGRQAVGCEAVAQALLSPEMVVTRVCRKPPAIHPSKIERPMAGYSRAWAWEPVQKVLASSGLWLNWEWGTAFLGTLSPMNFLEILPVHKQYCAVFVVQADPVANLLSSWQHCQHFSLVASWVLTQTSQGQMEPP